MRKDTAARTAPFATRIASSSPSFVREGRTRSRCRFAGTPGPARSAPGTRAGIWFFGLPGAERSSTHFEGRLMTWPGGSTRENAPGGFARGALLACPSSIHPVYLTWVVPEVASTTTFIVILRPRSFGTATSSLGRHSDYDSRRVVRAACSPVLEKPPRTHWWTNHWCHPPRRLPGPIANASGNAFDGAGAGQGRPGVGGPPPGARSLRSLVPGHTGARNLALATPPR
jgi:hypothetical protein